MDLSQTNPVIVKKQVCAYVRVSTDNLEQKTSFTAQNDEYTKRIMERTDWDFVGIFADEGISGTSTKHRKQFNAMIAKARQGKIDIILTKSISRFARNTVDALNYIRELRKINVEIIFEKENISTLDPKVEFLLTIMSSIAQEEARNTSENVKWNVQRRFREGVPVVNTERFLGYTKDRKGGNLVIVPEEAKTIRLIFELYLSGMGQRKIAQHLEALGLETGAGKKKWFESSVNCILKNEKYSGDLIQQKTISIDYLNHTKVKNTDIAPKYHIENSHEAIIDKETFMKVQRLRDERREDHMGKNKDLSKYHVLYPFSAMVVCSQCGRTLKRRYWNYGKPSAHIVQQCGGYIEGKGTCTAKATPQELIDGATLKLINEVFLHDVHIMDTIYKIIRNTIHTDHLDDDINQCRSEREEIEKLMSNLVDMKVRNLGITDTLFNTKYHELALQYKTLSDKISKYETEYAKAYDTQSRLDRIEAFLKKDDAGITELTTEIVRTFVYRMISVSPSEMVYCVAGIKNYSDTEFAERRFEFSQLEPIAKGSYYDAKVKKTMDYRVVLI
jgi:DNA invertase Pin-like site-specific DNA recombinase